MEEEELECRPDVLACSPREDPAEEVAHAVHGVEAVHHLEHALSGHGGHGASTSTATPTPPRAAPGSGGPHDPAYWRELDADMGRRGSRAVREERLAPRPTPGREPVSEDMRAMIEDMASPIDSPARADIDDHMDRVMTRYEAERLASTTASGDASHVPAYGEDIVWPPHYGARDGVVDVSRSRVGETYTRRGSRYGEFFAEGDPSIGERALAPAFDPWREVAPDYIGTDTEYTVAREFPVERSEVAPWFGREGGATQVRAPMSAGSLEDGGYLAFERSTTAGYADDATVDEIRAAVLECGDADDLRALAETEESLATIPDFSAADDAAVPEAEAPGMFGRALGGLGVIAGLRDMAHGVDEILDGEYTAGALDLGAGGLGAFTGGLALAGEAASIAPPVALLAGLTGAVSTGEHYNQDAGTFGTDEEGHGLSSVEFALGMGQDSYDYVHDGVAEAIDGGEEGGAGDWIGWGLGSVAGVGGTALGGLIGFGGDLYHGVPAVLGGLYDLVLGAGEDYNAEHDVWGDPTVDEDGHVHHMTSADFARANASDAYTGIHDAIADSVGGTTGEVLGTVGGGAGGLLVGAGAGIVGVGGDLARTGERILTSGDRFWGERGVWGETTDEDGTTRPRSSVEMIADDTVATYDDWHDAAAEAGLGETGSMLVGGAAGTAMAAGDSLLALGGNLTGMAAAGVENLGHAASAAWSWLTD